MSVDTIKNIITANIGNEIVIRVGNTEKRTREYSCIVRNVYRSVFLVEVLGKNDTIERKSFKYTDILTKYVEVDIFECD